MKNSANESSEKLKILVAEENQEACSALEELLKVLGHSVMVTQDGEDALKMFHETIPDLVFSGMTLPKLGGMELLREVNSGSKERLGSGSKSFRILRSVATLLCEYQGNQCPNNVQIVSSSVQIVSNSVK